ncbi:hypothetical protein J2T12_000133 [Paenibacillus anaericanus]|uniref:DUF960 family protein n=1 Tax=Paenibacillus anaericanus TaxID=170367 RepID=UPI00278A6649|nr:DUF960 family protein [Paenibacillus anaericanus]MDQ0086739.1 hypothetical protein [Paenibacillus anaericanus]
MFTGPKYVTRGIKENVPTFLQNILWYMIETLEVEAKDYLQVFHLDGITEEGRLKQKVVHTQEEPDYRKEFTLCTKQIVSGKIYVIDDTTHCTMLLAEEY